MMLLCHHDRRNMECLVAIIHHRGRPFVHSSTSPSFGLSWTSSHIEQIVPFYPLLGPIP
jgi:hypothetical protein